MKSIQVQSQPFNQSQTVNSQKIIIEPTKLTHCALVDGQTNTDGTPADAWIIKQKSLNEKTGGFTELAIKLVYDDIMSKYDLDPQARFLYNVFNKNVLWYADCSVGALSRWNHNFNFNTSYAYGGYTQISHRDLYYSLDKFKLHFTKYNERLSKSIRTYDDRNLNKFKMPAFITDSIIIDDQFEQAMTEWSYDQLVGLMIIEHYSKSTEDDNFDSFLDWIDLGAGDHYRFKLEETAINIFKKAKSSEIIKEVGETFFYCYTS